MMQRKVRSRGFTLIELLVVISIIGFLSSVVFASLSSARERGRIGAAMKTHTATHRALGAEMRGAWDLNDGVGSAVAADSSGYGNNGTIEGSPTWKCDADPDDPPTPYHVIGEGDGRCSLEFDGASDYVDIPASNLLNFGTGDFTHSLWVKTTSCSSTEVWFGQRDQTDGNATIWLGCGASGQASFHVRDSSEGASAGGSHPFGEETVVVNDGKWHQITLTKEGHADATVNLYVDGNMVFEDTHAFNGTFDFADGAIPPHSIAALQDDPEWYYANAQITDVRVYAQALTASEVSQLYAEAAPRFLVVNEEI